MLYFREESQNTSGSRCSSEIIVAAKNLAFLLGYTILLGFWFSRFLYYLLVTY